MVGKLFSGWKQKVVINGETSAWCDVLDDLILFHVIHIAQDFQLLQNDINKLVVVAIN